MRNVADFQTGSESFKDTGVKFHYFYLCLGLKVKLSTFLDFTSPIILKFALLVFTFH